MLSLAIVIFFGIGSFIVTPVFFEKSEILDKIALGILALASYIFVLVGILILFIKRGNIVLYGDYFLVPPMSFFDKEKKIYYSEIESLEETTKFPSLIFITYSQNCQVSIGSINLNNEDFYDLLKNLKEKIGFSKNQKDTNFTELDGIARDLYVFRE